MSDKSGPAPRRDIQRRIIADLRAARNARDRGFAWSIRITGEELDALLEVAAERDTLARLLIEDWEGEHDDR